MKNKNAGSKPALGIIFLVVCIDLIGFGIVLPLLPLYAKYYGASSFLIGLLAISYSVGQLVFSPIWGSLSDRFGRRPILLMSLTGASLFYTLFGWAPTLTWLFIARIGAGIFAGNISAAMAYIADITTREERTRGMGMIGAAFAIGFIIGPAIGGVLGRYSYALPSYGAAGLSCLALVLAIAKLPESLKVKKSSVVNWSNLVKPIQRNLRKMAVARPMLVYFLVVLAFSCMQITFPLFTLEVFGFGVMENGYLFAYVGVMAVLFQGGLIGKLARLFGEGPLALFGTALSLLGLSLLPLASSLKGLLILLTVLGIGTGLNNPTLTSLISLAADESEQGAVLGASRSLNTFARILGPLWGGWSYGALGMKWTYWSAGIFLFAAILIGLPLLRLRPAYHGKKGGKAETAAN